MIALSTQLMSVEVSPAAPLIGTPLRDYVGFWDTFDSDGQNGFVAPDNQAASTRRDVGHMNGWHLPRALGEVSERNVPRHLEEPCAKYDL